MLGCWRWSCKIFILSVKIVWTYCGCNKFLNIKIGGLIMRSVDEIGVAASELKVLLDTLDPVVKMKIAIELITVLDGLAPYQSKTTQTSLGI